MVVNLFLNHLLLEVASPIIFLPSPFHYYCFQEAKDSIDEEDPRPTSFTWSYIIIGVSQPTRSKINFARNA